MKKLNAKIIPALLVAFVFSINLIAQETVVSVKVEKDGKVVKDTTYSFEDEAQAEHALKMMDILCADDEHMMEIHKTMSEKHGEHSKTMIFISEDGETKEIKEIHGDSLVWITEGEHDGEHVKVMKYKMDGDEAEGKRVMVVKSGDGETFDILIDEECEGDHEDGKLVKKEITVIVSGDEDGEWTVEEKEITELDENEEVDVVVVKKKSKKQ